MKSFLRAVTIAIAALASTAVESSTEKRVALVVGNARYADAPLRNPANDARAMATSLRERGFEVILRLDATKPQMESAIIEFGEKLTEGATGLFFYAGHGMQVQGRNYIIPTDAKLTTEQRVKLEAVDVEAVLDQMQGARSKVNVVILDACRNNPFERRFRSASGGLAQINAPEGTLIAYATAPGRVAADGEGANGLYTTELLKALRAPGMKVEDVFKQVRINVARASNGAQTPWEASSLVGDFYFVPPAPVAAAPSNSAELEFWNSIRNAQELGEYRAYLARYPKGEFAELAQMRVAALEKNHTDAVERSRIEIERIRQETAENARVEIDRARREASEKARAEIESARVATAAVPPTATVAPAAVPVLSANGTYQATISGASWTAGDIAAVLEINGARVSGSATRASQPRPCRIAGTIASDGTLAPPLRVDCDEVWDRTTRFESLSILLEGRFERSSDGQIVGETTFRSSDRRTGSVVWRTPQAHAAAGNAVVAAKPPAPPSAPKVQQAALPSPSAPVSGMDGIYNAKFTMIGSTGFLNFDAAIEVAGSQILGKATTSSNAPDSCTISGNVDSNSGSVTSLFMACRWTNVHFKGSFAVNTQTGRTEGHTEARSVNDGRVVPVIWRR